MKPFKSRIKLQTAHGVHLFEVTADEARAYIRRGFADAVDDGRAFVGVIRLNLSLGALRNELGPKRRTPERPKPPMRAPASSTGDAGRGLALVSRYRVLHLERQAALG